MLKVNIVLDEELGIATIDIDDGEGQDSFTIDKESYPVHAGIFAVALDNIMLVLETLAVEQDLNALFGANFVEAINE